MIYPIGYFRITVCLSYFIFLAHFVHVWKRKEYDTRTQTSNYRWRDNGEKENWKSSVWKTKCITNEPKVISYTDTNGLQFHDSRPAKSLENLQMLQDVTKIPSTIKAATLKEQIEDQPEEMLNVLSLIQTSTLLSY